MVQTGEEPFKIPPSKPLSNDKITEKDKIYPVNDLPNRHGITLSSIPADCAVGCHVAASQCGCKLLPEEERKSPKATAGHPRKFTPGSRVHTPRR